ncbi:ATPase inhibitor [Podospora bellae-mahoneyi]|uniref:ATPase inhibitor, mitochondrial n=1 Tax=Podospora bellae-mahoneyi TaxID=2093777 RepID=A0ABR0FXQ2_9PEZI|nr:ATPase inhibitor [Podospora bellae-mahoneyi]
MLRTSFTKVARPALFSRSFAITSRAMAAGDTGAPPKTGGQGDAFQRREKAQEDFAIRQREKEKLIALRQKLREQQDHLQKLSDHMSVVRLHYTLELPVLMYSKTATRSPRSRVASTTKYLSTRLSTTRSSRLGCQTPI